MFPLRCEDAIDEFVGGKQWTLISSVSFEERWLAFPRLVEARGHSPTKNSLLYPVDEGSEWQAQCTAKQDSWYAELKAKVKWVPNAVKFNLVGSGAASTVLDILNAALSSGGCETTVIDLSAMPKACMFPMMKAALRSGKIKRLAAVYTEPEAYSAPILRSDPLAPAGVRSFNYLKPGVKQRVGWIPILGFGSFFGTLIYASIIASQNLEDRIFPVLGFPAYVPGFFERSLLDNLSVFLSMFQGRPDIASHIVYAPASDPFATKEAIDNIVGQFPDIHWIGSPLGPKPMALGMLMAAMDREMTIIDCQARSYHPDYSTGCGVTRMYLLKA